MSKFHRTSRPIAWLAPLLLPTLLGGCVNWSGDVGRYREVLDDAAPATRPAFAAAEPLSLREALRVANHDNEAIAIAGEDYVQALADKMRQAGTFLPTLSIGPSYSIVKRDGNGDGNSGVIVGGSTVGGIDTGGTVDVADSGGTTDSISVPANASLAGSLSDASNYRSSGRSVEQRRQLLLDQRETILLNVAQAYYDVLRFEEQARVLENAVTLREEQLRDQEARLNLGSGRPLDVSQSRADLAATRASLIQARTNAANARSALARLMGVPEVSGPLTDDYAIADAVPELVEWVDLATTLRQDLLAAARFAEAARLSVQAAIEQYAPSVSINFNYYLYNDPDSGQEWTGGISANLPIFSAMQIEADIRRAWSVYRQAGLALSQTRRQAVDDVRQSYQNLRGSRDLVEELQLQVNAAQEAYDLASRAYELGSGSNLDRLQQQDALLNAQLDLLDEQFNTKTSYLGLLRASGQLASAM